jgi:chromosome segregation ATPase
VEPIQATVDTTPSLLDHSLQQRQETLRLQEEKFSKYDKLQAEANNQVLTDENKDLKRQLGQQSGDLNHTCEEKKRLEKELSDKRLKIDQLLVERSQRIEHHQYALEQLQNRVAEDEKERNELEVRRRELEQTIKKITKAYDSEISQYRYEIAALQEKLEAMKAVVDDQSSTICQQRHEIRRLSSSVIDLNDKFEKKCTEFDEFKRDSGALIVFLVVFIVLVGLMLIVGLFKSQI